MNKKLLIAALLSSLTGGAFAQNVSDSASVGAGYANQTFYSFSTGTVKTQINNDWDLAFGTSGMSSAVLFNTATGNKCYVVPGKTPADFASADTAGIKQNQPVYNSDTTWTMGALNQGATSAYDLGWGTYDITTHTVSGSKVYIAQYSNGSYKKFYIRDLVSGTYTIIIADLNNANQQTVAIKKTDFNTKNFGYVSLANAATIDREPVSSSWDLLFTKYTTFIPTAYGVTGVLVNSGVTVAKAAHIKPAVAKYTGRTFVTAINTIGYDWKTYNGVYVVSDSLCYFVKTKVGEIYQLTFTGFGGSTTGKFYFTKKKVGTAAVADIKGNTNAAFGLYPNPASASTAVLLDNETGAGIAGLDVYDLSGKQVKHELIELSSGLNQYVLGTEELQSGIYFVKANIGGHQLTQKLIISK